MTSAADKPTELACYNVEPTLPIITELPEPDTLPSAKITNDAQAPRSTPPLVYSVNSLLLFWNPRNEAFDKVSK